MARGGRCSWCGGFPVIKHPGHGSRLYHSGRWVTRPLSTLWMPLTLSVPCLQPCYTQSRPPPCLRAPSCTRGPALLPATASLQPGKADTASSPGDRARVGGKWAPTGPEGQAPAAPSPPSGSLTQVPRCWGTSLCPHSTCWDWEQTFWTLQTRVPMPLTCQRLAPQSPQRRPAPEDAGAARRDAKWPLRDCTGLAQSTGLMRWGVLARVSLAGEVPEGAQKRQDTRKTAGPSFPRGMTSGSEDHRDPWENKRPWKYWQKRCHLVRKVVSQNPTQHWMRDSVGSRNQCV